MWNQNPIKLQRIKEESVNDPKQDLLKHTIHNGWPDQRKHAKTNWRITGTCDVTHPERQWHCPTKSPSLIKVSEWVSKWLLYTTHKVKRKPSFLPKNPSFWPGITWPSKHDQLCAQNIRAPPKMFSSNLSSSKCDHGGRLGRLIWVQGIEPPDNR